MKTHLLQRFCDRPRNFQKGDFRNVLIAPLKLTSNGLKLQLVHTPGHKLQQRGNENTASSGSKFLLERRDESVECEGQDSDKKFIEQYMVQR